MLRRPVVSYLVWVLNPTSTSDDLTAISSGSATPVSSLREIFSISGICQRLCPVTKHNRTYRNRPANFSF
jgi:hypothetical protein